MLKQYYEIPSGENMSFELHYLTNKSEKNDIKFITIPEMNDLPFYNEDGGCENYRHYCLKTISVKMNEEDMKNLSNFHIDKVRAYLTNGKIVTYPIGQIEIVDDPATKLLPVDYISSSGSSDHIGENLIKVKEPLSIQSFQVPFTQVIKDGLHLYVITDQGTLQKVYNEMSEGYLDQQKIDNLKERKDRLVKENILPLTLKKDDFLSTKYQFNFGENKNGYYYYQFSVNVKGTTKKGKEFTFPLWINYSPYFGQKKVDEIVKQRREIDHGTGDK